MQTPSASDPSFKAFLDKLQEQNNRGFVTQLVQLKAEREIAGEDNDKREEQLDEVISSLNEVRNAVTGIKLDIDFAPLVNIGENQTKLLEELNKEASLTRKLTEGSVEYDKEASQYRNTSGRDIESKVSGKTSKDGGFLDFETARDTLSGQGKRAKEANAFDLKPINYTPGKTVAAAVGDKSGKAPGNEEVDNFDPSLMGRLKSFMTDGESDKPGTGIFQTPSKKVEKKEREDKVSSPREVNPEADNITSTGEIQSDAAKKDLEISKQMLDTTKAQLVELKAIREALAPTTPKELTEQKSAPSSTNEKESEGGSSLLGDLASGASDLLGKGSSKGPKGGPSKGGLGSKSMGGIKGIGGKVGGIAKGAAGVLGKLAVPLAVATAGYDAYKGVERTNENFDLKEGEESTLGQKTSSALGSIASGFSFGALDEKSTTQGIHKAGSAIGNFFTGGDSKVTEGSDAKLPAVVPTETVAGKKAVPAGSSEIPGGGQITDPNAPDYNSEIAEFYRETEETKARASGRAKGGPVEDGADYIVGEEGPELFMPFKDGVVVPNDTSNKIVNGKIGLAEGGMAYAKYSDARAKGDLLANEKGDTFSKTFTSPEASNLIADLTTGLAEKYPELEKQYQSSKLSVSKESQAQMVAELQGTSTENKDLERDAKGKGGVNNTAVSNNVSSNNTTKFVPMKSSPRAENTGSALDRYTSRITTY